MGKSIPDRRDKLEEKVILTLPDNTEYLVTLQISDTSTVYYFGSIHDFCVVCQVFSEDSIMARFTDVRYANISNVYYDELCCVNRKFIRGEDTRALLQLVFSFIRERHPHLIGAYLTDKSTRTCDNGNPIDLALMHYLQDGQTWYMSRFGAFLEEKDIVKLKEAESKFTKENIPFELIQGYSSSILPMSEEELKKIYDSSISVLDFFHSLYKHIGASEFCIYMSYCIDSFMREYFKFNFSSVKFTISFDNPKVNPPIEFSQKLIERNGEVQSGGYKRKYTRKQRRHKRRGAYL
jgi:hypothetical protein